MYRRPILCTLYGAVFFLKCPEEGLWGGGGGGGGGARGVGLVHSEIYYVPVGDGWEEVPWYVIYFTAYQ